MDLDHRASIEKRKYWNEHVQNLYASGLNKKAYSREHNISYDALKYWCRQFPNEDAQNKKTKVGGRLRIVQVKPQASPPNRAGQLRITFRDCVLDIEGQVNEQDLSAVIRALRAV